MTKKASRRKFIKTTRLGVAGLGLLQPVASQAANKREKKVEIAIATITMDGFGDMNFEKGCIGFCRRDQRGLKYFLFPRW